MKIRLCLTPLVLILVSAMAFAELPDLGDASQSVLTPAKEKVLGKYFMRAIKAQIPLVQDPIIYDYVNQLGHRLAAQSPGPSRTFHFFVVNDSTINSFAGPDGYIGVNSGLITTADDEGELAAVVSHEIAHVVQGHIARFYTEQRNMTLPMMGAILASILVGIQNPEAGMGAMMASTAGAYQHVLNFSRSNEYEADRVGMQILAKSGFDPHSMPRFFEKLEKAANMNDADVSELLQTHPITENRLADAYNRADQYPRKKVSLNPDFPLIQARTRVKTTQNIMGLLQQYESVHETPRARYGYVLTLLEMHKAKEAKNALQPLLKSMPNDMILQITHADIESALGHKDQAVLILNSLYQDNPNDYAIMMYDAHFLMLQGNPREAAMVLKAHYADYKENENYLYLLSQAYGKAKQLAWAYQTRAEIYLLNDRKREAIDQLEMAQKYASHDHLLKQVLIDKINTIKNSKDDA